MQNTIVKYVVIIVFLLVYINRGVYITPVELKNQGGGETNSLIEWIQQLVTGESNDIDEDGDMQTDWNATHIFICDFPPQLTQIHLFSKEIKKKLFPYTKNFLSNEFCSQLEQPPEV